MRHNQPLCCQTLPEGDGSIAAAGQDPGVRRPLAVGAHAHVGVQAEAQQEAAQQGGVILAVALQTQSGSASDGRRRACLLPLLPISRLLQKFPITLN